MKYKARRPATNSSRIRAFDSSTRPRMVLNSWGRRRIRVNGGSVRVGRIASSWFRWREAFLCRRRRYVSSTTRWYNRRSIVRIARVYTRTSATTAATAEWVAFSQPCYTRLAANSISGVDAIIARAISISTMVIHCVGLFYYYFIQLFSSLSLFISILFNSSNPNSKLYRLLSDIVISILIRTKTKS